MDWSLLTSGTRVFCFATVASCARSASISSGGASRTPPPWPHAGSRTAVAAATAAAAVAAAVTAAAAAVAAGFCRMCSTFASAEAGGSPLDVPCGGC